MNTIDDIKKARDSLTEIVNKGFDLLIEKLENPSHDVEIAEHEITIPLLADPANFIGKKPTTVLFGEERVEVKSWREVYGAILIRCNENPRHHEMLMYLRDKAAGKCRVFLSGSPDSMTRPLQIDEGLYGEVHYGSETLMHILVNRILIPVRFDCTGISIIMKSGDRL